MRLWLKHQQRMNIWEDFTRSCIICSFKLSASKGKDEREKRRLGHYRLRLPHQCCWLSLPLTRARLRPCAFMRMPYSETKHGQPTCIGLLNSYHVFFSQKTHMAKTLQTLLAKDLLWFGFMVWRLLPGMPGTTDRLPSLTTATATVSCHFRCRAQLQNTSRHQAILCLLFESNATHRYNNRWRRPCS